MTRQQLLDRLHELDYPPRAVLDAQTAWDTGQARTPAQVFTLLHGDVARALRLYAWLELDGRPQIEGGA